MKDEKKKSYKKRILLLCGILLCILLFAGTCGVAAHNHLSRSFDQHPITRCQSNLKVNGVLCYLYAEENGGNFPDTPDYIRKNSGYMQCLKDPDPEGDSYFLIPGLSQKNSPGMPLMIEKIGNHKEKSAVIILYTAGNVMRWSGTVQNYPELLPVFSGITPEEKKYLHSIFTEWGKGNFSFKPDSPFKIKPENQKEKQ